VRRHITVVDLPAPFATESARHNAKIADAPDGAVPRVPPGFRAALFAKDLKAPRLLRFAPNGDLFAAASDDGEIQVVRAGQSPESARVDTFAKGFDDPFGIAFFPPGPAPAWVYVAEVNAIYRYPYVNGDRAARGPRETVVAPLARSAGGHTMRDIAFSKDGRQMFVAVGSASNVAEKMPASSPEAIRAFEAEHGLGAAWDAEESRADVLVFDVDGKNGRPFATGLRNCSGLTVNPSTGDVWCAVNERDKLGDNLVPDYVTRVREKAFYRGSRTGYKVVRIIMKNGAPTGEYEDFMTGFVIDEERVWARPVGVAVDKDGSLFVSDDGNGTIWRVVYR
jgi:glucose/arabinose dehydrogenase